MPWRDRDPWRAARIRAARRTPFARPFRQGGTLSATLHVCVTCRKNDEPEDGPRTGAALARAVSATAPPEIRVVEVKCLATCKRGPAAALSRPGAWGYVIGGLDTDDAAPALIEAARQYAADPAGLLPWRGRPETVKRGLIARFPPHPLPDAAE